MKNTERLWTKNFIAATLANLILFIGFEMVMATLPLYISAIGGNDVIVGLAMGIFTLVTLGFRSVSGVLLDRFGRRGVLTAGFLIMTAATACYGFVTSIAVLIVVRMIHGAGWGLTETGISTVASDNIPKERLGEGMGYYGLSDSLGMAVGPALGLMLLSRSGFGGIFGLAVATLLTALAICQLISYRNMKGQKADDEAKKGAWIEKTAVLPTILILLVSTSYGAIISFLVLFAEEKGIGNVGIFFTTYAAALLVSRPLSGTLVDKRGFSVVIYPSLLILGTSFLILGASHAISGFLISAALYGVAMGALMTSLHTMAVLGAPASNIGSANATFLIGFDCGVGIGSFAAGVFASVFGYGGMFQALVGFFIAAGCCFYLGQMTTKRLVK